MLGVAWTVPETDWLLPVGISFYTFQTLAYTIDVYRGLQQPEHHLGRFALYVSFFPQLVAGPIERSQRLLPQFRARHFWDDRRVVSGLRLMGWGFFKKLVIADRLALLVDTVYGSPQDFTGVPLIVATYAFAWQIYCDFSGYTDIAIGAARVLGYELMQNFDRPYASQSMGEFWKRWHISLSTWFRDYLYIPLGGNRVSLTQWQANLIVTFMISGLWHGASWTFVYWGGLHAVFLIAGIWLSKPFSNILRKICPDGALGLLPVARTVLTFHAVLVAWILFRAATLSDAWYVVSHAFRGLRLDAHYGMGIGPWGLAVSCAAVLVLELVQWWNARGQGVGQWMDHQPRWLQWSVYYALFFFILMFGRFDVAEFIYFQF